MHDAWPALGVFLLLCLAIPSGMLAAARALRVRAAKAAPLKLDTYECGEDPDGPAWVRFHPRYFVVALFFVLFDAEVAFLVPWGLVLRELGAPALAAMIAFLAILMLGWVYAVRKGMLRWQ